jgi:hypothetical protein
MLHTAALAGLARCMEHDMNRNGRPARTRGAELFWKLSKLPSIETEHFINEAIQNRQTSMGRFVKGYFDFLEDHGKHLSDLFRQLRRHRKPKRNADRDAEIMRLHSANKTAGQIAHALAGQWKLTDKMVNAVISRERRSSK